MAMHEGGGGRFHVLLRLLVNRWHLDAFVNTAVQDVVQ